MFDFEELDANIDDEGEKIRQEEEKRTRRRRKVVEEKQKAKEEKARLQEQVAIAERQSELEKIRHLQTVRYDCERLGLNGDWCADPELLMQLLETAKGWSQQGIFALKGDAGRLKIPTSGLPLGFNERVALLQRMWNGLVWHHLSREQLQEEANRRRIPFFVLDGVEELQHRLIYDAYGCLGTPIGGNPIPKPMEVRNGWSHEYKPRGKDNPPPISPWTGQRAELGPDPNRGESRTQHRGPPAQGRSKAITADQKATSKAAEKSHASTAPSDSNSSALSGRTANFLKVFPNFSGELPSAEEEQLWTNLQMHVYFKSNGEIKPDTQQEAKNQEEQRKEEERKRLQELQEEAKREEEQLKEAQRQRQEQQMMRLREQERQERDRMQREAEEKRKQEELRKREEFQQRERQERERQKREQQGHKEHQEKTVFIGLDLADEYAVLGLAPDATFMEVRRVYRSLALLHHPDKKQNPQDADAKYFKRISAAYEAICQHRKR